MLNGKLGEMRLMTYNIRHGLGTEGVLDLERIARVIAAEEPDVVAIQEIDRFWSRSGGVDQPEQLADLLGMNGQFAPNLEMPPESPDTLPIQYGVMVLSKLPVRSWRHIRYPEVPGWESRGLLEVHLELEAGHQIAVFCTHFQVDSATGRQESMRQRTEQIAIMNDHAASLQVPVVMMGDFNAEPDAPELIPLLGSENGWQDAWTVAGTGRAGLTVPAASNREAERRIDYILISATSRVTRCEVRITEETRLASDHFPVIADVSIEFA